MVLDVHSGAVHVVDELTYRLLALLPSALPETCPKEAFSALAEYPSADVEEAYSELYSLFLAGELYSPDDYQPFAERFAEAPVKSMCLNVAHDCNLRCAYCFAAQGDFGRGRELMPLEVAKAALDFLVAHSGPRKQLEVDFFGGEPLMNFDVVKATVAYGRSLEQGNNKRFRFTLTTNGLLLNEQNIAFINREMSNVVLSLDGRREVNDRLRVTPGGQGCYDRIVAQYKTLVQSRGGRDYYLRGTFTRENLDFANDVKHLIELGFDQISIEPVVSDERNPFAIRQADLPRVFAEYETLAQLFLRRKNEGNRFCFFHFMLDLDQGPCAIKRLRGCSCGNEYLCVTPDGDIYPCHQFVGQDDYRMGNLKTGNFDNDLKKRFSQTTVYHKKNCQSCWAKFYCSGGCNANNAQFCGDVLTPHTLSCELEKKRVECAIMLKAAELAGTF